MTNEQYEAIMEKLNLIHKYVSSVGSSSSSSKSKAPYMWENDLCPECGKGYLVIIERKAKQTGAIFQALACNIEGCKGFAYISKYPKKEEKLNF